MSDESSSSDDDIPLSALGKKPKGESSDEEAEFNDDEDDDEEMGDEPDSDSDDFIADDEEDDDEDGAYASDSSDDNVLLSALKSPQKPKAVKAKKTSSSMTKKAAPKKKTTSTKSSSSSSAKKKANSTTSSKKSKASASSSSTGSGGSNYLCASNELYSRCDKGKLIQSLLSRWWYACQWPDPKILMEPTPRGGYDALDGFPGVYICTQGSNVGKFIDRRDHTQSPSFRNFARKSSEELKDLLLAAIEKQMKELIQHEGEGTETEKNLKALSKWAMKLDCAKADASAEKVLKAKRLVLS